MSACLTSLTLLHHNTYASMHDHMHFHGRIKKTLKGNPNLTYEEKTKSKQRDRDSKT